jgi:hypothetical protein
MRILTLFLFLVAASIARGQTDSMIVELYDASVHTYAITQINEITFAGDVTGVTEEEIIRQVVESFALHQNYPNPFNPATTIEYMLPSRGEVEVAIFDLLGRQVRQVESSVQQPGLHRVRWDGRDESGNGAASGTYFCRVRFNETFLMSKLALIK